MLIDLIEPHGRSSVLSALQEAAAEGTLRLLLSLLLSKSYIIDCTRVTPGTCSFRMRSMPIDMS